MLLRRSLYLLALCGSAAVLTGQTPPGASPAQPLSPAPPAPAVLPSVTMQPSLDVLKTALSIVRVDRWKASGAIRNEAESNVASIQRDLDATLPGLIAAADASPSRIPRSTSGRSPSASASARCPASADTCASIV